MNTEEAKKLAEEHWAWLETLLHKVYVDALIHGIKHGCAYACDLERTSEKVRIDDLVNGTPRAPSAVDKS